MRRLFLLSAKNSCLSVVGTYTVGLTRELSSVGCISHSHTLHFRISIDELAPALNGERSGSVLVIHVIEMEGASKYFQTSLMFLYRNNETK